MFFVYILKPFSSLYGSPVLLYVEPISFLSWSIFFFILMQFLVYIEPFLLHLELFVFFILKAFVSLSCSPFLLHRDAKALTFSGPCSSSQSRGKCVGACFLWILNLTTPHTQITQRDAQTSAKNATSERMCVHKINFESSRAVNGK